MLPGAYRRPRRKGGRFYIYWYESREKGAAQLASFSGASLAEVERKEREQAAALAETYAAHRRPPLNPAFMMSLIRDFTDHELPKTEPATQRVWKGHLREIEEVFGDTSLKAMQQDTTRALIKRWHENTGKPVTFQGLVDGAADVPKARAAKWVAFWQDKAKPDTIIYTQPRTANYRLTVLVRVLNWGIDEGRLVRKLGNQAAGIKRLDEGPGRASITWTDDELKALLKHCSTYVGRAVRLASLTGMRLADVVALRWSDIDGDVIRRPTSKSRSRRRANISLYPALRDLLAECPKVGPHVVVNSKGVKWKSADSFDSSLRPALDKFRAAGGADKHFHDLRGNAATAMYLGGLSIRQIALAMAWTERETENRLSDYVDLDAAARAMAAATRV